MRNIIVAMAFAFLAITGDLFAGGNGEALSAESTSARDAEIQAILSSIDIRTFESSIAAVEFGIPNLAGEQELLSEHRGEFVFLNFWATWCPPCREEMPSMETLHQEMDGRAFAILAVNVREDPRMVEDFVEDHGYQFPVLLDESGAVSTQYGVRGIPTSYFISPEGRVLGMLVGTRYWDDPKIMDAMRSIAELSKE